MNEEAQLPTPITATLTFSPNGTLPLLSRAAVPTRTTSDLAGAQLTICVHDTLNHGERGQRRQYVDHIRQHVEEQTDRHEHDPLRTAHQTDLAFQSQSLGAGTRVADQQRTEQCDHGDGDIYRVSLP